MQKNIVRFLFSLLLVMTMFTKIVYAQPQDNNHFVILVIDQIHFKDLNQPELTNFKSLLQTSSVALMNTTTGGGAIPDNTFTTIGASSRALGSPGASQSFNTHEKINGQAIINIYERRNPLHDISQYQIVNLSVAQIKNLNEDKHYQVNIGALGDALHKAGLKTTVIGNSDLPQEEPNFSRYVYNRQSVAMLMDSKGLVDYGDVSNNMLIADKKAPFGVRTDQEKLLASFNEYYKKSNVLVIDYGDTTRVAAYAPVLNSDMSKEELEQALHRADGFLGELLKIVDLKRDYLMVVTPTPSESSKGQGNTLTPLVLAGPGIGGDLLTSGTTHRPGIVTNTDIGVTILHFLGVKSAEGMIGQNLTVTAKSSNSLQYLSDLQDMLVENTLRRVPILSTVAFYILAVLACSLVMFILRLFNHDYSKVLKRSLLYNYLAILTLPFGLLIIASLGALTLLQSFVAIILITVGLTTIIYLLSKRISIIFSITAICLAFIAILFTDLFMGATMILNSPLGYDPQYGARFYGIGNELMGAVIGATTVGVAAFMDMKRFKGRLLFVIAFMVGVLFIMVYPGLGSKGGASISVTAAFVTLLWLSLGYKTGKRQLLMVAASVVLVMLFISLADLLSGPRTHIGRAVLEMQTSGIGSLLDIIIRKLQMDFRLMRYSYWSGMLVTSIFLMLLMFKFRLNFLEHIRNKTPNTLNGCYAALFGAAVALFTNDAGIIAAATAVIYPVSTLLLLNMVPYKNQH
ncbi:hypothetical protein [Desulforamulus aeronauticus]|uniref:Uncharacterized protein n=1 Tax=Desulforamulus aeronauticus DSM 10349 TaxID=1121421 RepID=A0A1M6RK77_9FIRM|nr:hypothetical protein [Desulforamulus aeronauticus]SHK32824.1 hypothetical protein SAMN02745123_01489 [Desulforamulus aeronauticus DSM 10349]